jgi:hypothetical protein
LDNCEVDVSVNSGPFKNIRSKPAFINFNRTGVRAMADANEIQQNQKEFFALLPLTLALAGLPTSDSGRYYSEEQIESRAFTIRNAYKTARQVFRECVLR